MAFVRVSSELFMGFIELCDIASVFSVEIMLLKGKKY